MFTYQSFLTPKMVPYNTQHNEELGKISGKTTIFNWFVTCICKINNSKEKSKP